MVKTRALTFVSIICLSALLLTSCLAVPVPVYAISSWNVETVSQAAGSGNGYCPIVVDSNNNAHIAYTDKGQGPLIWVMYASCNGSGWNAQIVDWGSTYDFILDSRDNPYILYEGAKGLMYASWIGTNWT
jgi:hypothetical protein